MTQKADSLITTFMEAKNQIQITTFYYFFSMSEEQVKQFEEALYKLGEELNLRGLFIIGTEGVNTTYSGAPENVESFKREITKFIGAEKIFFKDSFHDKHPFNDFKVKVRDEIVTLNRADFIPNNTNTNHLTPEQWHKVMNEEDVVIIDTRNDYEVEVGKFKGALNPNIKEFTEFPEYVKQAGIEKDKKVLIYCTGGIRCEKAIYEMKEQGYDNCYQLEGGIINYLKKYPNQNFEGECFVFDYRVAVDQNLGQTQAYRLCPHCGQPGKLKIDCVQCGEEEVVCQACVDKDKALETCSKNCAHHFRLGHKTRKPHLDGKNKRHSF